MLKLRLMAGTKRRKRNQMPQRKIAETGRRRSATQSRTQVHCDFAGMGEPAHRCNQVGWPRG
jgi:hypothetical protein